MAFWAWPPGARSARRSARCPRPAQADPLGTRRVGASPRVEAASRPRVDLLLGIRVAIEVDEFQHFTTARLRTLQRYGQTEVGFDVERYRVLCEQNRHRADAYRQTKTAADFPFPGGRTVQRAYLDAVRDLLGPAHGWKIVRIPAPDGDLACAVEELIRVARTIEASW